MKQETKVILHILTSYLEANPEIRFCQALSNLHINDMFVFDEGEAPEILENYYDTDLEVLQRIYGKK